VKLGELLLGAIDAAGFDLIVQAVAQNDALDPSGGKARPGPAAPS
jgi:hypothetical protein